MQLTIEKKGSGVFIRVVGRIDTVTSAQLDEAVGQILAEHAQTVIFDLAQVDYLASSAFRVFIKCQKLCRANGGEAVIQQAGPLILPLFKVSGFDKLFRFSATDEESGF